MERKDRKWEGEREIGRGSLNLVGQLHAMEPLHLDGFLDIDYFCVLL